jgi:hypothetical protein
MYSLENNILVIEGTLTPKISILNSILVNGLVDSNRQYANISNHQNFAELPGRIENFNGIWNFENVRFVSYCTDKNQINSQEGHILSNNLGFDEGGMYVILSNCKFYCTRKDFLAIWFDVNGGVSNLEILGTSVANSNSITNIGGIVYLGAPQFIVTGVNIIDPSLY